MKHIFHSAKHRGHNQFSWLDSYHSFSFGHYYDQNKIQFGVLRVLNDDTVSPGMGFGTHPHSNMEIVSIPLHGVLEHKDSMGTSSVIRAGDVQIMSAGTGVQHSEFNHSKEDVVKFLQIWVFPRVANIQPQYDQKNFANSDAPDNFTVIVDPLGEKGVKINQDAWFGLWKPEQGESFTYKLNKAGNGVYAFVISGSVQFGEQLLGPRDASGIWEAAEIEFTSNGKAVLLLIEIPMEL